MFKLKWLDLVEPDLQLVLTKGGKIDSQSLAFYCSFLVVSCNIPEVKMFAKKSLDPAETDLSVYFSGVGRNLVRIPVTQPSGKKLVVTAQNTVTGYFFVTRSGNRVTI